jgi:hypothetical protein
MKKWLLASLLLVVMIMAGCTPTIYGVPQERWDVMSEAERVAAMDAYRARQAALQERMREQARQRVIAEEARLAQEAEEARLQQLQIEAIYRGKGIYGDLLRVTLHDGMLKFYGAHKPYRPFSFKIAAGEAKEIQVLSQRGKRADLLVSYDGGNLLIDETPRSHRSQATSLVYDNAWSLGKTYPNLYGKGPLELRGVSATVEILGTPPRDHQARRRRQVIIVERPAPKPEKPQVIVIREQPDHHQHQQTPVVVVKEQPRPQKPPVVVVKEQPRHHESNEVDTEEPLQAPEDVVGRQPTAPSIRKHPAKNQPILARNRPVQAGPPTRVSIAFQGGRIKARGKAQRLVPQSIELNEGEVRTITLRGERGAVKIQVSYLGGEIQIDDRPGKNARRARLGYDPGWKSGRKYRVEDTDLAQLEDLDILVMAK